MRGSATAAGIVFGIGVGVVIGPFLGDAALWAGVVIAALGIALSAAGPTDDRYLTGTGSRPVGHDGQQFALGGPSAPGWNRSCGSPRTTPATPTLYIDVARSSPPR